MTTITMSVDEFLRAGISGERNFSGKTIRGEGDPDLILQFSEAYSYSNRDRGRQEPQLNFERVDAQGIVLPDASLWFSNFNNADFSGADLSESSFEYSYFTEANFRNANLEGAELDYAKMEKTNLEGANLEGAKLNHVDFLCTNLKGANLRNAQFKNAKFRETSLGGADVHEAEFTGTNFEHVYGLDKVLNGNKAYFRGQRGGDAHSDNPHIYEIIWNFIQRQIYGA